MSFKKIKPTKTNLIKLKKRLKFATKGENFLQFKREQLMVEIKKYWGIYLRKRKEFLSLFRRAFLKLNETYKEMGRTDFNLLSEISVIQSKPEIQVKYEKIIGNVVPQIEFSMNREKKLPPYSFDNTSHHLDDLMEILKEFIKVMINIAEIEDLTLKFSFNFKKLSRRINALKNKIIPDLELEIKKIKEILEEVDRENFVRLKKTKDLIGKKQKIEIGEDMP